MTAPNDFALLLRQSTEELKVKTLAHQVWGFGNSERWDLNQTRGILVFTQKDGVRAACPAQIIGSYNTADQTWLWGWANPSIDQSLKRDALQMREYGRKHGIERLSSPQWKGSEAEAWEMTALAVKLCNEQGAYRGPAGQTLVFIAFGEVQLSKRP
jgi:hypothetical protein